MKPKYLIDDHLKAKCSAQLRVELVDDTGACHTEGLPSGVSLEVRFDANARAIMRLLRQCPGLRMRMHFLQHESAFSAKPCVVE